MAVVGAGPVGLALALHAAQALPQARITVFDARPPERDVAADPRTLALSLGSVQFLQRLGAWAGTAAQAITEIHVSQQPPSWGDAEVRLGAAEFGVPQLGAVLGYGALLAPLQAAWLACAQQQPQRLHTRFGTPVAALKAGGDGVEVDAGIAERFDLAVVAEGGVFGENTSGAQGPALARRALNSDYGQTAWVGTATLQGATPGMAFERFTRHGPAALLPLPPQPDGRARAALVWCVAAAADPVRELSPAQRLAVLNTLFPAAAGRLVGLSPLKDFALGLKAERTLVSGRIVRIGNAAQTLHPVAGQGLNLGLRDAHELVAALRRATDLDSALRRVERARAPDRWSVIVATDFLARSFTWQLPGAATARGLGLAALQALPPVKGWLARRMMFGGR
ncbi:MAG: 2-octaprenyl-6-methoxyphenyl hydroxylase [Leptothrix sp. (in: Bacteria)]|nr:2-octaprenyl-6-methoxyphenyl hydroxylase [Leptothrix sp. (in: b-proteobacteria)]